jgi:hypothetical protein
LGKNTLSKTVGSREVVNDFNACIIGMSRPTETVCVRYAGRLWKHELRFLDDRGPTDTLPLYTTVLTVREGGVR